MILEERMYNLNKQNQTYVHRSLMFKHKFSEFKNGTIVIYQEQIGEIQ